MTPEEYKLKNYWNNIKELAEWANSAYYWARDGSNANAARSIKKMLDTCQNEVLSLNRKSINKYKQI
jgi:hypothetical protein